MLPPIDQESGFLPEGVHECSWDEFFDSFVIQFHPEEAHRELLVDRALSVFQRLRAEGVRKVSVGGSFISASTLPKDIDVFVDASRTDIAGWSRNSRDLRRAAQWDYDSHQKLRKEHGVDLNTPGKIIVYPQGRCRTIPDAWEYAKGTEFGVEIRRGIVRLDLSTLP